MRYTSPDQFFADHKDHVIRITSRCGESYAPSGSDLINPQLWKAAHWNYWMEQEGILPVVPSNTFLFKQLKNRYNDVNLYKRFVIWVDKSKMKLYDVEKSEIEKV